MAAEGWALACAAERFVGVPFKLHGRNPELGLDCVGLVSASLDAIGRDPVMPMGYRMHNSSIDPFIALATENGLNDVGGDTEPGDIFLTRPGPGQHHLMIASTKPGFIHAHAGLRRVVLTPGALPWEPLRHWRLVRR